MYKETDSDRTDANSTHDCHFVHTPISEVYRSQHESPDLLKRKRPFECDSKNILNKGEKISSKNSKSIENFASYNLASQLDKRIGKWTKDEDDILCQLVNICGAKNWKKISEKIEGRTPIQCLHRWTKILQPGLVKGPWTIEEDRKLINWVKSEGATRWSQCAEYINGRNGKQCRERWFNTLNPKVKRGHWTYEEDYQIFFLFKVFGGKWSKINELFECRSENSIKNRFYSILRRIAAEKRKEQYLGNYGFDNETHNPENKCLDQLLKYLPFAIAESTSLFCKSRHFNENDLLHYNNELSNQFNASSSKRRHQREQLAKDPLVLRIRDTLRQTEEEEEMGLPDYMPLQMPTSLAPLPVNTLQDKEKLGELDLMSYYKTLEVSELEKDIASMCDNPSLFYPANGNLEFNNVFENIFGKGGLNSRSNDQFLQNNCADLFLDSRIPMDLASGLFSKEIPSLVSEEKGPQSFDSLLSQLNNLEEVIRNAKNELLQQVPETQKYDNCELKLDFSMNNDETLFNF